jgi:hypothetical protein
MLPVDLFDTALISNPLFKAERRMPLFADLKSRVGAQDAEENQAETNYHSRRKNFVHIVWGRKGGDYFAGDYFRQDGEK